MRKHFLHSFRVEYGILLCLKIDGVISEADMILKLTYIGKVKMLFYTNIDVFLFTKVNTNTLMCTSEIGNTNSDSQHQHYRLESGVKRKKNSIISWFHIFIQIEITVGQNVGSTWILSN